MLCVDYLGGRLDPEADLAAQAELDRALECSARDEIWAAGTACQEEALPDQAGLAILKPAAPHWQNERLSFNPETRLATPAQRSELLRRDGYRCKTPGCPHHQGRFAEVSEQELLGIVKSCASRGSPEQRFESQ